MDYALLDLYVDYLLASTGKTAATGLSALLNGALSHDRITRFLAEGAPQSRDLWRIVKPHVRMIESEDGVIIIDDSIEEKPYTDENDIICWHYDHAKGRSVKGINFMTAIYASQGVALPVGFQLIAKTEQYWDEKQQKEQRRCPVSKNTYFQQLLRFAVKNKIPFRYVLTDVWYASCENMMFITHRLKKDFIVPLKSNRKVALSPADQRNKRFEAVDSLTIEPGDVWTIYLDDVDFPLLLIKEVFHNDDGSIGVRYLVTSDLTLRRTGADGISDLYRTRWKIEEYHKSLKQNASLEQSPTRTVKTQTTHFFASVCAYVKLELFKAKTALTHARMKTLIYLRGLSVAFRRLRMFQPVSFA